MNHRHSKHRETPAVIYTGLKIHALTRKRELVDILHNMGLSISYDRLLSLSVDIVNAVIAKYEANAVVCPRKVSPQVFATGQVDNIDHNPSAASAKSSFHGTGISITEHPLSNERINAATPLLSNETPSLSKGHGRRSMTKLPAAYATVHPVELHNKKPKVPFSRAPPSTEDTLDAIQDEHEWVSLSKN